MKERTRKILIIIGLIISCAYVVYQLIFLFEAGPSEASLLPFLLEAILIITILLSRKYISGYFKNKNVLTFCLAFMILAIILDDFYEIAFQLGEPIHPILWLDLFIRSMFFIPWIHMWLLLLYYFDFSVKQTFYVAGLQGIIGEYFILWIFFPQFSRFGYYISLYGFFSLLMIPIDWIVVFILYGFNMAVPYSPFREIFKERIENRETSKKIKYFMAFVPLVAFAISAVILLTIGVHVIIAYS